MYSGITQEFTFCAPGKGKISKDYICTTNRGLSCQLCNHYACVSCVMAIRDKMPKRASAYDQWSAFVDDKKQQLMQGIVQIPQGHCCEWKRHGDAASKATRAKKKVHPKRIPTKYSGYLHYLGCNLLVDSPTNGVIDIHGAGEIGDDTSADRDKGYVKGVMHCVLNTETCVRLAQNNVKAKTMK